MPELAIGDIEAVALPVPRHRIGLNFAAHSAGIGTDDIVKKLLATVPSDESLYDG